VKARLALLAGTAGACILPAASPVAAQSNPTRLLPTPIQQPRVLPVASPAAAPAGPVQTPTVPGPRPIGTLVAPPLAPDPLAWRWTRFRTWEYPVTVVALVGAISLRAFAPPPGPDLQGGFLVDDYFKQHAMLHNRKLRSGVVKMTDVFFFGSMAYRLADSTIAPTFVLGRPDLALQLSMIDLEAFGFVAAMLWVPQTFVGRERPVIGAGRCRDPAFAKRERACDPDGSEHNRSLFAGHPAVVMASAGLTCSHHRHLPLYGGGNADILACGLMVGAAGFTGVGRVLTGKHHVSDLVIGYIVGGFAGFGLPELLHYRHRNPPTAAKQLEPAPLVRAAVIPQVGPGQLGLGLSGVF
jgi:membrane-associated phospholipid phosphatase